MVLAKDEESGMRIRIQWLLVLVLVVPMYGLANSSALILSSVPGDTEHAEKFTKWGDTTKKLLIEKFGFSADHVILLADKQTAKAEIQKAFDQLRTQLKP